VGTQVVLVGGVNGGDGYLRTNRRLEWSLLPGSVGQFIAIGEGSFGDYLVGDFTPPRIVTAAFAVGSTSRVSQWAGGPQSGVRIVPGQSWITVGSPVEGVSRVTLVAPEVVLPQERAKSAAIYWVDAQYGFPDPAVAPAGTKQTLTTTVWRLTNHCPRPGWFVRYEFVCGPQSFFGPSGTSSVEVPTNDAGQAIAEIFQKEPSPGTSQIRVQVFRPADQCGEKLLVRENRVLVAWTDTNPSPLLPGPETSPGPVNVPSPAGPDSIPSRPAETAPTVAANLELKVTADSPAIVGDDVTFSIVVTNRGAARVTGIIIRDEYGDGFMNQNNSPLVTKQPVDLAPGQSSGRIPVTFRVTRAGRICHHVEARIADVVQVAADSCVIATAAPAAATTGPAITPPPGSTESPPPAITRPSPANPLAVLPLEIRVSGLTSSMVGKSVVFTAEVINRGQQPISNVVISQSSDAALVVIRATDSYTRQRNEFVWTIPSLPPNKPERCQVECECRAPGNACCRFAAAADKGQPVSGQTCVQIAAAPSPSGNTPSGNTPPTAPGRLTVTVDTRNLVKAGKNQAFLIQVANEGDSAENDIVVTASVPQGTTVDASSSGPSPAVKWQMIQGELRFDPVAELPPKTIMEYRVVLTTTRSGELTLQAKAVSRRQTQATGAKTADILPP
jgi:uncharacterized repeat protein (TIGR01451 family)